MAKKSTAAKSPARKSATPKSALKANAKLKASAKRRLPNPHVGPDDGAPATHQDPKRRLGNFTGTGEAPRRGGRTGIVKLPKGKVRGERGKA